MEREREWERDRESILIYIHVQKRTAHIYSHPNIVRIHNIQILCLFTMRLGWTATSPGQSIDAGHRCTAAGDRHSLRGRRTWSVAVARPGGDQELRIYFYCWWCETCIYIYICNQIYLMFFFPTCQVRVVRFYVSCLVLLLLLSSPPPLVVLLLSLSSPPPRRPPRPPRPTATRDPQCSLPDLNHDHPRQCALPDLNHDHPRPVFPAGPQPRPSTPSVPCRTSTTTITAQCSLPDLNHDHPRPVFPAGPQPRPSTPSVPCRTSTASIPAQCSLPDLNHDHPRPVFPAGPQPRPSTPSVPCRTSTASIHAKRYAR